MAHTLKRNSCFILFFFLKRQLVKVLFRSYWSELMPYSLKTLISVHFFAISFAIMKPIIDLLPLALQLYLCAGLWLKNVFRIRSPLNEKSITPFVLISTTPKVPVTFSILSFPIYAFKSLAMIMSSYLYEWILWIAFWSASKKRKLCSFLSLLLVHIHEAWVAAPPQTISPVARLAKTAQSLPWRKFFWASNSYSVSSIYLKCKLPISQVYIWKYTDAIFVQISTISPRVKVEEVHWTCLQALILVCYGLCHLVLS